MKKQLFTLLALLAAVLVTNCTSNIEHNRLEHSHQPIEAMDEAPTIPQPSVAINEDKLWTITKEEAKAELRKAIASGDAGRINAWNHFLVTGDKGTIIQHLTTADGKSKKFVLSTGRLLGGMLSCCSPYVNSIEEELIVEKSQQVGDTYKANEAQMADLFKELFRQKEDSKTAADKLEGKIQEAPKKAYTAAEKEKIQALSMRIAAAFQEKGLDPNSVVYVIHRYSDDIFFSIKLNFPKSVHELSPIGKEEKKRALSDLARDADSETRNCRIMENRINDGIQKIRVPARKNVIVELEDAVATQLNLGTSANALATSKYCIVENFVTAEAFKAGKIDFVTLSDQGGKLVLRDRKLDDLQRADYASEMAFFYNQRSHFDFSLQYIEKQLEIILSDLSVKKVDLNLKERCLVYMKDGSSKSILELKSLVPENKWLNLASSYNNIGMVYDSKGELDKALEFYNKALEIQKEKAPNSLDLAGSYNNIGLVYRQKGELDKALEFYNKALEITKEKAPNSLDLAASYNNIGLVYRQKGDAARAEEYLKKAEEIKRKAR